jgi:hypothetical protein
VAVVTAAAVTVVAGISGVAVDTSAASAVADSAADRWEVLPAQGSPVAAEAWV